MAESTAWEYHVVSFGGGLRSPKDDDIEAGLNELGEQGWEIVGMTKRERSHRLTFVAKRPMTAGSRRRRALPGGLW